MTRLKLVSVRAAARRFRARVLLLGVTFAPRIEAEASATTERAARRKVLREYRKILERDLEQLAEMERGEG